MMSIFLLNLVVSTVLILFVIVFIYVVYKYIDEW